jgi:hypothetical protein
MSDKINSKENTMYRHGEIVIKSIKKLPEGKTTKVKTYIVGHSETGHHHVLESPTAYKVMRDKFQKVWLELEAEAKLIHQKTHDVHETLTIPAGIYEVGQKSEYNPFTKQIEAVRD